MCHNHGLCHVTQDHTHTCRCDFGWTLSKDCKQPIDLAIIVSIAGAFLLLGMGLRAIRRRFRRMKKKTRIAYQRLEEQYTSEVQELSKDWLVRASELELMDRIDRGFEGTFAEVYMARWHNDTVAVKRLRDSIRAMSVFNATITSDFEREIRTLRRTRHRNVVLFYGAGEWAGCSFLVIEYCERGSLRSIIQNSPELLDTSMCCRLALDAAKGMRFLHSLNPPQIHRDLKSANLLVTENWVCKVADLGTSRLISELTDAHGDGDMLVSEVEQDFVLVEDEVGLRWEGGHG